MQKTSPGIAFKAALLGCLMIASVRSSRATLACPVSFLDGSIDTDGISLSFRNKGKLPIQELDFICQVPGTRQIRPSTCHEETGLFFPGNSYDLTFLYASKGNRSVRLFLQSARLSDGSVWRSTRDQLCRPLTIDQKKTSTHR